MVSSVFHVHERSLSSVWSSGNSSNWNVFIVVGVVCALLVVLLMAALYLLRVKQKKGGWLPFFLPQNLPLSWSSPGHVALRARVTRSPEVAMLGLLQPLLQAVGVREGRSWPAPPRGKMTAIAMNCIPPRTTAEAGSRLLPGYLPSARHGGKEWG